MIKYTPSSNVSLSLFKTPFEQELDPGNRWVKMAALVPWDEMAKVFFNSMSLDQGRASVDLRTVLGALLVKHIEGLSDEDTIRYIQENVYAQYFVGLASFQPAPVFVATLFVEIRKRLGKEGAMQLNDAVLLQAKRLGAIAHRAKPGAGAEEDGKGGTGGGARPASPCAAEEGKGSKAQAGDAAANDVGQEGPAVPNRGTLKVDATVAPQHVGHPTDTRLLAEARECTEQLIDKLFYGAPGAWAKKPRTYRRNAKKEYLSFSKKRSPRKNDIKRARGKQLRYLRRNLGHIGRMLDKLEAGGLACPWAHRDWLRFWALQELYRQQDIMHRDGRRRIDDRIVNLAQPYVRPIKRGKAGKNTEFGAKLNVSETEGFVRPDQISFDNFNESKYLEAQVMAYKALYGYFPEVVLADRIYLTRENRKFLKDKGIRHCGPPLGRAPEMAAQEKRERKKEQDKRSEIEGKFGQAKSKYGLDDIRTRRLDTSYACIVLILAALNVIKLGGAFLLLCAALLAALAAVAVAARRPLAELNSKMGRPLRGRPALVVQSGIGALTF